MLKFMNTITTWLADKMMFIPWWAKITILVLMSLITTMFPAPPLADTALLASLGHFASIYWFIILVLIVTLADTIFGIITYYVGNKVTNKITVRMSRRREHQKKYSLHINPLKAKVKRLDFEAFKLKRRAKRDKQQGDIIKRLQKSRWAGLFIFVAAWTPIPWTLTIYAASAIKYDIKYFIPVVFLGRLIKYAAYGVLFYLSISAVL